jgi:hypothetical protein
MWLDAGRVRAIGPIDEIAREYEAREDAESPVVP